MLTQPFLRRLILVLAVLFGLGVAIASVVPIDRIALGTRPRHGASLAEVLRAEHVHTAAHIVLFSALAFTAWLAADFAAKVRGDAPNSKRIALLLLLLLGCGIEYLQHLFYRNKLESNDIITNLLTSISAFAVFAIVDRYRKHRTEPEANSSPVV